MFGSDGPSSSGGFGNADDMFSRFASHFGGFGSMFGGSPFSNMHREAPNPNGPEDGADI